MEITRTGTARIKSKHSESQEMRPMRTPMFLAAPVILFCAAGVAAAQSSPGVVTGGSADTTIGGKPATREGDDTTKGGPVVQGSPNVFINGKPAAIVGGNTGCGGVVISGSPHVFINGKPAATVGSQTTDCKGQ